MTEMTPEKSVQNSILRYLAQLKKEGKKIMYERRQAGGFSYKKGIPDIYFVYDGIHVELEVKRPGGELSSMQKKYRDMCFNNNVLYLCADSVDVVKSFIETFFS